MKYTKTFKLKVVKEFLKGGVNYMSLAQKYNMPAHSVIKNWVDKYNLYGEDGLEKRRNRHSYTFEYKLSVVEYFLANKTTHQETADKFNISNATTIFEWVNKYQKYGAIGLRPEGSRLYMEEKKKNRKAEKRRRRKSYSYEEYHQLLERNAELQAEVDYLKALRRLSKENKTNIEKAIIVHDLRKEHKLKDLLNIAGMAKSTYEYCIKNIMNPKEKDPIENEIISLSKQHPTWGYKRICGFLVKQENIKINIKKVHRIWKENNLQVKCFTKKKRNFSTYKGKVGKIAPNRLKRRFNTNIIHQKIVTDTSEFKYYEINDNGKLLVKKAYLDPFMDLYNREIISYSFSKRPSAEKILKAQDKAIKITNDCPYRRLFHSDQGWAYQMNSYRYALKDNNIIQSMSRKGNCHDNSVMENFFGLMKQEMYYDYTFYSFESLMRAVTGYISYYNNRRIKESLGWLSPVEFRKKDIVYKNVA